MQVDDILLDGILHHQTIDGHRPFLANPMSPVGGLVLDGRIHQWSMCVDMIAAVRLIPAPPALRLIGKTSPLILKAVDPLLSLTDRVDPSRY